MNKEEAKKEFGKILKRIRLEKGMSQEELAHKVGYKGRSAINKIETGTNDMSRDMIVKCADALGISPLELFQEAPSSESTLPMGSFHGGSDDLISVSPDFWVAYCELSDKNKEQLETYAKYLLEIQKGDDK